MRDLSLTGPGLPQPEKQALTRPDPLVSARKLGLRTVDLDRVEVAAEMFTHLPVEAATRLGMVPLEVQEGRLLVAISDPLDLAAEKRLRRAADLPVDLCVASKRQIAEVLKRSESSGQVLADVSQDFQSSIVRETADGGEELVDMDALQDQQGVTRLLSSVLLAALQKNASDVHIEAYGDRVEVKYRVDSILSAATEPLDAQHHAGLVSRVKVMANLDIAEKRVPQDGRFRLRMEGRDVDFRVSVLPSQHGENVVIRVLDKSAAIGRGSALNLSQLGLTADDVAWLRSIVRQPYGLVLMTGPTGSGKTTTLYAALSEISDGREKIITIEDPVEYELDGITQIAVNEKKGLTFAAGLRSILRHDPDRIMVGEIRDRETAEIAVQAALTGHLVLASVHANNAIDVVSRFTHWGIDLHDFVTALRAVAAQRLLRRACSDCLGTGCAGCRGEGFDGRVAVIERLSVTPGVAEAMIRRAGQGELTRAAVEAGMIGLRDKALALVEQGVTTRAELDRVVQGG